MIKGKNMSFIYIARRAVPLGLLLVAAVSQAQEPIIASITVSNESSLQLDIAGVNLSNGSDAVVTLGTFGTLSVDAETSTELVASAVSPVASGDYLLTIATSTGSVTYDLTITAVEDSTTTGGVTVSLGNNTAAGKNALLSNTTGVNNSAFGRNALYLNSTGKNNTAIGTAALYNNDSGDNNTAGGNSALRNNTSGTNNTANGSAALLSNTSGNSNTAIGVAALQFNSIGHSNTASGVAALKSNTTGNNNTATGRNALLSNTTGIDNTASGTAALRDNTSGYGNTASGASALRKNTTGRSNTASGITALYSNTTGEFNTASGNAALFANTTGIENTATGDFALFSNTTGEYNSAHGAFALTSNTTGDFNAAFGALALNMNETGTGNTAGGPFALFENTTGFNNTALGNRAGTNVTTGDNNTALGNDAAASLTSGNNNIMLGTGAGANITTGNNNIAIGNPGHAADANTIRIGNGQTKTFVAGIAGTNLSAEGLPVVIKPNGQLGTGVAASGGAAQGFWVGLSVGETTTLITNGDLSFRAQCSGSPATPKLSYFFKSPNAGWFCGIQPTTEQLAGAKCDAGEFTSSTPSYRFAIDQGSAVTPAGYYIGVDHETLGAGLKIFGHDCLAVGSGVVANAN